MTDLLSIGASGLKAYSRAMSTIGDNIANAQTPGYARRTLALKEMASGTESALVGRNVSPGGVTISGLSRSVDKWLIDDARASESDATRAATRLSWMNRAEDALSNDNNGISTNLTKLFTTADKLTADPNNTTLRAEFLQTAKDIAAGFQSTAKELSDMSGGIADAAQTSVGELNTNLDALERINDGLRKARPGSTNEASLLDERDRLIDQIATQMPVTASYDDRGTVTLRASSGDTLVGNATVTHVAVTTAADGRLAFSVGGNSVEPGSGNLAGRRSCRRPARRARRRGGAVRGPAQRRAPGGHRRQRQCGAAALCGGNRRDAHRDIADARPGRRRQWQRLERQYARHRRYARRERSRSRLGRPPRRAGAGDRFGTRAGIGRMDPRRRRRRCARQRQRGRPRSGSRRPAAFPAGLFRRRAHDPGRARDDASAAERDLTI